MKKLILWFKDISIKDVPLVGGKNASLGEMFSKLSGKVYAKQSSADPSESKIRNRGINVPDGFALTSKFYWRFIKANSLQNKLKAVFTDFNPESIASLQKTGKLCRQLVLKSEIPDDLKKEIAKYYRKLSQKYGRGEIEVAVRTSGIAEDSPKTSFAGQFETFLNVRGAENIFWAVKQCLISVFTDRAITYRDLNKIPQLKFALSVGVQKMVRSDLASSGIIFTIDTESGFPNIVLINGIWGVGEMIVKGRITPDEFQVFKPLLNQGNPAIIVKNLGRKTKKYVYSQKGGLKEVKVPENEQKRFCLTEEEILALAKWACLIEKHYSQPQDIEWAKDGLDKKLYIVQSRPETVYNKAQNNLVQERQLKMKTNGKKPILQGIAVGNRIGQGKARIIENASKISGFKKDEVLVTRMTDPDWLPAIRQAAAVVTDEGGRTCHAAIVSRELGIPAIVGAKSATKILKTGQELTIDCSSGQGLVFEGKLPLERKEYNLKALPKTKIKVMVNIGTPEIAYQTSYLPATGVGLARIEFILTEKIGVHPLAIYHFNNLKNKGLKSKIDQLTFGYKDKKQFFVDELCEGISQIAAAFWPKPIILRLSDLKSNEYCSLVGGELFEPQEQNPMLGLRGAARYYNENFRPAFEMECRAIKKARDMGFKNINLLVPFCRTPEEGKKVLALLKQNGLKKSKDLKIIVMCEIPSNVILADKFLEIFDGMSIGSNDLTQLVLGLDRDSSLVSKIGDERNEAVKIMISKVIKDCKKAKKYCGICGQAPSDFPDFIEFLVKEGIESISVNPDALIKTIINIARIEK
jgi:pyruvate,water dikinase